MADCAGRIKQRICCIEHRHELARFNEGLQGDQIRPVLELYRRPGLLAYENADKCALIRLPSAPPECPPPLGSKRLPWGVRARRVSASE